MDEEWRDIIGFEGCYQVSCRGRIKSLARKIRANSGFRLIPEQIMTLKIWHGYQVVWLRKPGVHQKFKVHRLVATAFHPNPEQKEHVNHKNKDRCNNTLDNLEWMTHAENMHHRDNYVPSNEPF